MGFNVAAVGLCVGVNMQVSMQVHMLPPPLSAGEEAILKFGRVMSDFVLRRRQNVFWFA